MHYDDLKGSLSLSLALPLSKHFITQRETAVYRVRKHQCAHLKAERIVSTREGRFLTRSFWTFVIDARKVTLAFCSQCTGSPHHPELTWAYKVD